MLVLKAKLEAVEAGITTMSARSSWPTWWCPGDVTVGEALLPRLDEALNTGRMPDLAARRRGYPAAARKVNMVQGHPDAGGRGRGTGLM